MEIRNLFKGMTAAAVLFAGLSLSAAGVSDLSRKAPQERTYCKVLSSPAVHNGGTRWKMQQIGKVCATPEALSSFGYDDSSWMEAIVPGTVLRSLVHNGVYPDPYYSDNNSLERKLIPDLADIGRDFYSYWFRTELEFPSAEYKGRRTWLQLDGINYHAEVWLNGKLMTTYSGMFHQEKVDITDYIKLDGKNVLAIRILPIDSPGRLMPKYWGAQNEYHNGGDGEIGRNVTMLMSVGWDFTFHDGIRDRNTGIWKDVKIFTSGDITLAHPFVRSELSHPDYDRSSEIVTVDVRNASQEEKDCTVEGEIEGTGIRFSRKLHLFRGEIQELTFSPEEFPQLTIDKPRLWWPVNKGSQELYSMKLKVKLGDVVSDSISTRFGIREIRADRNTPDSSKIFYINGKRIFITGTNWIPEAMCQSSDERMYTELRYTASTGINMLRLWGGGITESDYFYDLCDELGLLVWEEFWMTGDTKHPVDQGLYLKNVVSAVKRTRSHPCLAFYVCSNESSYTQGVPEILAALDGTRPYQMQSECDGIHDGSPYKQVNPMEYYENTASDRGSRVDGFNPEYGTTNLPTVECLREMMDEKDLWPINKKLWDYRDGNGFFLLTSLFEELVNQYGESSGIDEYAEKAQFVGAMNYKTLCEVWRYNKLGSGDRWTSGYLFWYHNSPLRQVRGCMWDWSLEPTAALFATANATEPMHPMFDYLKNTVSVSNDLFTPITGCKVRAELYDLKSRKLWSKEAPVNVEADATTCDIFEIPFPEDISPVHFIKLRLFDAEGRQIGSNFYWRSTDKYLGRKTVSGPTTAGFQAINELPVIKLSAKASVSCDGLENVTTVTLRNTSRSIAFFTRLQWLGPDGKPCRPSYYDDNFFCLLPGEAKKVEIRTELKDLPHGRYTLVIGGFHQKEQRFVFDL